MHYDSEEVAALIDAAQDGEGLSEMEERMALAWIRRQKRDGMTRKEIIEQVIKMADMDGLSFE